MNRPDFSDIIDQSIDDRCKLHDVDPEKPGAKLLITVEDLRKVMTSVAYSVLDAILDLPGMLKHNSVGMLQPCNCSIFNGQLHDRRVICL